MLTSTSNLSPTLCCGRICVLPTPCSNEASSRGATAAPFPLCVAPRQAPLGTQGWRTGWWYAEKLMISSVAAPTPSPAAVTVLRHAACVSSALGAHLPYGHGSLLDHELEVVFLDIRSLLADGGTRGSRLLNFNPSTA